MTTLAGPHMHNNHPNDNLVKRWGTVSTRSLGLFVFILLLAGNALDAYNLGPVPIPWLSQAGAICAILFFALVDKAYPFQGMTAFVMLFCWACIVGLLNLTKGAPYYIPPDITTPYPLFLLLRYLSFISFFSAVMFVYWLLRKGHEREVIRWAVNLGVIVSCVAIYIYFAQIYNLPEPPRNRMGTFGGEQTTVFIFWHFHRAMGTFREPSFLAQWLVVPLFLSFALKDKLVNVRAIIIGLAILLSISLAGVATVVLGFLLALIVNLFRQNKLRILAKAVVNGLMPYLLFPFFAIKAQGERGDFWDLIQAFTKRLTPIVQEGMQASNRQYVYKFLNDTPIPLLGYGLGNSNLVLSYYVDYIRPEGIKYIGAGLELVRSYLSLYFNTLYSLGFIGLIFLLWFFATPLIMWTRREPASLGEKGFWVLSAYLAWLIMYAGLSEEFTMMSAVIYALLIFYVTESPMHPNTFPRHRPTTET